MGLCVLTFDGFDLLEIELGLTLQHLSLHLLCL